MDKTIIVHAEWHDIRILHIRVRTRTSFNISKFEVFFFLILHIPTPPVFSLVQAVHIDLWRPRRSQGRYSEYATAVLPLIILLIGSSHSSVLFYTKRLIFSQFKGKWLSFITPLRTIKMRVDRLYALTRSQNSFMIEDPHEVL
jgi:hypothetical protein